MGRGKLLERAVGLKEPFATSQPLTEPDWLSADPEFDAWVATMPQKYWAKYDLSACRLGWHAHKALQSETRENTDAAPQAAEYPESLGGRHQSTPAVAASSLPSAVAEQISDAGKWLASYLGVETQRQEELCHAAAMYLHGKFTRTPSSAREKLPNA